MILVAEDRRQELARVDNSAGSSSYGSRIDRDYVPRKRRRATVTSTVGARGPAAARAQAPRLSPAGRPPDR
jgi:hypothetical protein